MDGLLQSPRRLPPTGRGQEGSAPAFLLPESRPPPSPIRRLFQDLTPCCSEAGESLTHFYLTLTRAPRALAQRGNSGGRPSITVTGQPFLGTFFVLNCGALETQS